MKHIYAGFGNAATQVTMTILAKIISPIIQREPRPRFVAGERDKLTDLRGLRSAFCALLGICRRFGETGILLQGVLVWPRGM